MNDEYLWVYATVFAAAFQCARIALQRQVAALHGNIIGTAARYILCAPLTLPLALVAFGGTASLPEIDAWFLTYVFLTSTSQIVASFLLLHCFTLRNFAIGAVLSRTEALQIAIMTPILLDEQLNAATIAGVVISVIGVFMLTFKKSKAGAVSPVGNLDLQPILYGLGSGFFFAVSSVFVRKATGELIDATAAERTIVTLVFVITLQAILMLPILIKSGELVNIRNLLRHPGMSLALGITTLCGSLGWYLALSLTTAVRVQVLGQVSIVFIVMTSWLWFREKPTMIEIAGFALMAIGIVKVIASG